MNNTTDTELLVQLMDGELPEPSRQQLLQRLEKEPALQSEWEQLTLSKDLLDQFGRKKQISFIHAEMMAELANAPAENHSVTGIVRPMSARRFSIYSLRAVAAVLVIILLAVLYPYFTVTPEKLFASHYSIYVPSDQRGGENGQMAADYRAGDWQKVTAAYLAGSAKGPQEDFLAGNAFLKLNNPAAAMEALSAAQKANQSAGTHFLEPDTDYYLALASLAANQPKTALPLLTSIYSDPAHPYHDRVSWWFLQKVRRLASR